MGNMENMAVKRENYDKIKKLSHTKNTNLDSYLQFLSDTFLVHPIITCVKKKDKTISCRFEIQRFSCIKNSSRLIKEELRNTLVYEL